MATYPDPNSAAVSIRLSPEQRRALLRVREGYAVGPILLDELKRKKLIIWTARYAWVLTRLGEAVAAHWQ